MREMLFDGPQRWRDNGCIAQIFKMDGEDFRGGLLAWSSAFGKVRSPGFSRAELRWFTTIPLFPSLNHCESRPGEAGTPNPVPIKFGTAAHKAFYGQKSGNPGE
ncbi:MAG: hypothetical protein ACHBMF_02760 [Chromatiales bacterium]